MILSGWLGHSSYANFAMFTVVDLYQVYFHDGQYTGRGGGFPVRCVRDFSAVVSISEQCCRNFKTSLSCFGTPYNERWPYICFHLWGISRLHPWQHHRLVDDELLFVELESLGGGPVRDATCHVRPLRQGFNRQSERKRANDVKVLSCFGVY